VIHRQLSLGGGGFALAILAVSIAGGTALAESAGAGRAGATIGREHPEAAGQPKVDLSQQADQTNLPQQGLAGAADGLYDQYIAFKNKIQGDHNLEFSMPVSVFGQWGTPKGGPTVAEVVYSPTVTWTPFTDTPIGSGAFNFAFQGNQFWTGATTDSQHERMGLLAPPNDWGANSYQFAQIAYTHTFPGNWLAVSVGQYSFGLYDSNQYAGSAQTNFINYTMAQNGTQTYANAGTGGYVQISPGTQLHFAGGLQSATDIAGQSVTTSGFRNNQTAYFGAAQWTPSYLAGGTYGVIYYSQPSVPLQPSSSRGISFSAVQNLNERYGLFLCANNASGDAIPIETSVAFGGIVNNPFGRTRLDQAGIGIAWNKTNTATVGEPSRGSEWVAELYYSYTVFKALQLTPDLQVYVNPVLAPSTSLAAVFSLRTTFKF
jgi:hypothetical protein